MPDDRQTAALLRPIRRKCSDDYVSAGTQGDPHALGVGCAVARVGQEMERGPVVPNIVAFVGVPCCDVCDNPSDVLGLRTEPVP